MSDDGGRIRATRAPEVAFIADPDRINPRWYWSPGVGYVLDVDWPSNPALIAGTRTGEDARHLWRRQAREAGETWVSRSTEACRAILMRARRQKHPLIRTNVYVTQPARRWPHGYSLIEQPLRVLAVIDNGDWYVWTDPEDLQLKQANAPLRGAQQSRAS